MSKTSKTIDTWTCDFCGATSDTELARFTDGKGLLAQVIRETPPIADACTACVSTRTLAELATVLAEVREAGRYVAIKPAVVRPKDIRRGVAGATDPDGRP